MISPFPGVAFQSDFYKTRTVRSFMNLFVYIFRLRMRGY